MRMSKLMIVVGLLWAPLSWAQGQDPFDAGDGNDPDPFGQGVSKNKKTETDLGFTLTLEVFSVPMAKFAEIKRSKLKGDASYQALLKEVKEGRGTQDKLLEVRTVSGETVTVEQVREYTYPTEYEPAEVGDLPKNLPEGFKDFDKFVTPALPTAFDTKNLGDTVEVTLSRNEENPEAIGGRLTFSHVSLDGMVAWGEKESEVEMPKFSAQKINSAVNLKVNELLLLGSLNDPSEGRENHVWVVAVTVFEAEKQKKSK